MTRLNIYTLEYLTAKMTPAHIAPIIVMSITKVQIATFTTYNIKLTQNILYIALAELPIARQSDVTSKPVS